MRSGPMTTLSYFVALPFVLADDGSVVAGGPIECASAGTAILQAEVLSKTAGVVRAVAFSRTGDPDIGISESGQQFEYRMTIKRTIKSIDRKNADTLSSYLRGRSEVIEFRITPTGD